MSAVEDMRALGLHSFELMATRAVSMRRARHDIARARSRHPAPFQRARWEEEASGTLMLSLWRHGAQSCAFACLINSLGYNELGLSI